MKVKLITLILISLTLTGCGMNIPRPVKLHCGMPKDRLVQQMSAFLVSNGYTVNFSSAETGTIQAEYDEGAGFMVAESKRQVSLAFARDTVTLNIKTIEKTTSGTSSVQTWDLERARGATREWVAAIIDGVQQLCESTPIKSGN